MFSAEDLFSKTNGDSPNAQQQPVTLASSMATPGPFDRPTNVAMFPPPPQSLQFPGNPGPLHPPPPFDHISRYSGKFLRTTKPDWIYPADHHSAIPQRNLHDSLKSIRQSTVGSQKASAQHPTGPAHSLYGRRDEHTSLDTGIEEEENQFVNPEAFAELTLEDVKDTAASGEAVAFRQVSGDHNKPTFFIRNPSLIYGLTQAGGAAFFQRACEIVGYEWPPRLLPLCVSRPSLKVSQLTEFIQVLAKDGGGLSDR